jgi:hypothetical protein
VIWPSGTIFYIFFNGRDVNIYLFYSVSLKSAFLKDFYDQNLISLLAHLLIWINSPVLSLLFYDLHMN